MESEVSDRVAIRCIDLLDVVALGYEVTRSSASLRRERCVNEVALKILHRPLALWIKAMHRWLSLCAFAPFLRASKDTRAVDGKARLFFGRDEFHSRGSQEA
jgi:hypothetical protein